MSAEMKICRNCVREIPIANYEMHSVHCQRNLQLCPSCNEPVPRSQLEEHTKEFHSLVKCTSCFCELENAELNNHKERECSKRIVSCQYCDLDLKAGEIPEHENYCGSRTEICEGCGKLIMLKYREMHVDSNHRFVKENEETSNESEDDNNAYSVEDDEDSPVLARRGIAGANHSRFQLDESRYHRDNTRHLEEYFDNLVVANNRHAERDFGFEGTNRTFQQDLPTSNVVYLPCEFCQSQIAADELILHQTGCQPHLMSFGPSSRRRISWQKRVAETRGSHLSSSDDEEENVHADEAKAENVMRETENDVMIPCEFCSMPFLLDAVGNHQLVCRDN